MAIEWGDHIPEEKAYEVLRRIFEAERERHERQGSDGWLDPRPRSPLAVDDAAVHPYAVSHTVTQSLIIGNDHLLTLAHLLSGADPVLPAFASFTIARAAIETAAAALWTVGPEDATTRRTNLLRWHQKDGIDFATLGKHMGRTDDEQRQDREEATARAVEIADRLGIDLPRRLLTSTEMLTAEHIPATELPAVAAWSAASGYAHGRQWATLTMSEAEWRPSAPGVQRGRITADARILFWFVNTAHLLRNRAEQRAQELGRAPRPSAAAWRLAASG
ncbi:hypothetical protein BJF86_14520 [Serinicoccus sp. CNJ-927]|uniref:hypothetical protein n=1 Tax=Serinicoccus sp. CNJ-927 TaxID=1904970 RepID=UPI000969D2A1|nr:hypothetical protein [Serinicoccus sp. CNJ-927]OLT42605.1 hypothetical protein BJF86_14520 [Serinicoccus sp. CNJ-927]